MNNKHYVNPKVFNRLWNFGKIYVIGYMGDNENISESKTVIDSIREVNAEDSGFKYTCECTEDKTIWRFVYTTDKYCSKAEQRMKDKVISMYYDVGYSYKHVNTSACVCPLE